MRISSMRIQKKLSLVLLIVIVGLAFVPLAWAEEQIEKISGKVPFRVPRTESKIEVNGDMAEAAWQDALKMELKYEAFPGDGIAAPVKTEVFLISDDKTLFVAFRAYDPNPSAIRAHMGDHDELGHDDWVGVVFDTFNDSRFAFEFFCNPLGVQGDMIESIQGGGDQWDGIWNSSGRITADGYIVEMGIPFSTLRFQRKESDQIWGFDAVRLWPREHRYHMSLLKRDRNYNCYLCQTEKLVGFYGAKPGKNIEFDPTLSAVLTQERPIFSDGEFTEKEKKVEPGITARWGFTNNLTLSATVNPDFSTVEADVAQLDVNTQFALFYPEKRPFFLEGSTMFNSLFNLIHTRSLVDPDWGVKMTGKEGGNAVGFFSVQDNMPNLIIPGNQRSRTTQLGLTTLGNVLRYRRDVGRASTIGLVVTDREGDDYFNRLAGLDGDFSLTRKDRVRIQFIGTQTAYPDDIAAKYKQPTDDFDGSAFNLHYYHNTSTWDWYVSYRDVDTNFRADLGYMPQVGYRLIEGGWQHTWQKPKGSWFTKFNLGSSYEYETDNDGNLLYKTLTLWLNYSGPMLSAINLEGYWGKKHYLGIEFDDRRILLTSSIRPSNVISFALNGIYGDQIDFSNVQPGTRLTLNPVIEFSPGSHMRLFIDQLFETLDVSGGRLYKASLTNLKMVYQFNRRTFLRAIIQYSDTKYTPALYPFPMNMQTKDLFTQILFSYKINPQTVLFLGYSDTYDGNQDINMLQNTWTVFLKLGYALVL